MVEVQRVRRCKGVGVQVGFKKALQDTARSRTLAERTATVAATAIVGASFMPGLLRRKPLDQAIATGLSTSIAYGLANLTQSYIAAAARRIAPGHDRFATENRKYVSVIANTTVIAGGVAVSRALVPVRGEPVKRAALRTGGSIMAASGATGLVVTLVQGGVEAYERKSGRTFPAVAGLVTLGFGAAIAGIQIVRVRRDQEDSPAVPTSLLQGAVVAVGVSTATKGVSFVSHTVSGLVRQHVPGLSLIAEPIGHGAGLGLLGIGVYAGLETVNRQAEQGGTVVEEAYSEPPDSPWVSGGNHSGIEWNSLSREGRRFVNMVLSQEEITAVTEQPSRDPIRIFVGLESAPTVDARVALAMDELDRLGAFDRSVLCVTSPTGTGYINYVLAETLEFATGGDCVTVGMQYSVRPSFLSLDKVALGREQNRALMTAIYGRLMGIPKAKRPKVVLFGESLGAHTMQDAFMHEGTAGFERSKVDRALFVGTPAESKWADQWRLDPERYDPKSQVVELANIGEYEALSAEQKERTKYILLSHHDDPITKFEPQLMVQEPDWMKHGPERSPALPEVSKWYPFTSFVATLVDMKNAMDVKPGKFEGWGHDYRLDIPRFTLLAYGLDMPADAFDRMYQALEKRELKWAESRLVSEQIAQAQEAINRQLSSWQVEPREVLSALPTVKLPKLDSVPVSS